MKNLSLLVLLIFFFFQCGPKQVKKIQGVQNKQKSEKTASSPDELAIKKVINNYFEGWLTGDTSLIGSAMHSTCHLKFVRKNKVDIRNRTEYLSNFKPRPRLPNAEGRIISIDITRTAAEAKVELETVSRLFTDYFNLLKENNRWYITDKVSTNIEK